MSRKVKIIKLSSGYSDYQEKVDDFSVEISLTGAWCLIEIFLEAIKPEVLEWIKNQQRSKSNKALLSSLDSQHSNARNKKRHLFHRKNIYSLKNFDSEPARIFETCSFRKALVWISRKKRTNVLFGVSRLPRIWCKQDGQSFFIWKLIF